MTNQVDYQLISLSCQELTEALNRRGYDRVQVHAKTFEQIEHAHDTYIFNVSCWPEDLNSKVSVRVFRNRNNEVLAEFVC